MKSSNRLISTHDISFCMHKYDVHIVFFDVYIILYYIMISTFICFILPLSIDLSLLDIVFDNLIKLYD